MESMNPAAKLAGLVGKYKHAILVLLIGFALMLLPIGENQEAEPQSVPEAQAEHTDLESRLEQILARISGAGAVEVLLTEAAGQEILYQTDKESDSDDSASRQSISTVIIEDAEHQESGLIRRTDPPVYLGAVVVCQGADDPTVKLAIVEAVRCVTGLGADHITVVKMK